MNKKIKFFEIIKIISLICATIGIILFIPFLTAIAYNEYYCALVFSIISIASVCCGSFGYFFARRFHSSLDISSSMLTCFLSWLASSLIGALPFMAILGSSFTDSLFESVSGFTTTGITVLTGLDSMPRSLLLWRSLTQWVGGLGILTFFMLITFKSESDIWKLFDAESHKAKMSRPVPNLGSTIRILWGIYLFMTIMETICLVLLDVSFYDSLLHSFTSISTGGFSPYDESILQFHISKNPNYVFIEYVITFFMFASGVNFLLHYKFITGGILEYIKNAEFKFYLSMSAAFTILVFSESLISSGGTLPLENVFRRSVFQVISIMTTTGFSTEYIGSDFFGSASKIIFMTLMLIGGCVGSTAGGVKILRISILARLFSSEIFKSALPKSVIMPVTLDRVPVENKEVLKVCSIFFGWLVIVFVGSVITGLFSDLGPLESLSGMLSAVGNIGPFYFGVEKMASLSPFIKFSYILGMLAGRLEILPVFIIVWMNSKNL